MNKRILITGITGFVGSHLAEYCLKQGDRVCGTLISHHLGDETKNIEHLLPKIDLRQCNLMNRSSVFRVLNEVRPDIIFHLAAHSFVPMSWKDPQEVLQNNIISELNIFETIRDLKLEDKTVIQIACSSEEYGLVKPEECPIKETQELRPMSPYAVSKVAQEMLAKQYHYSYGLKTVITRAFNHEGARRGIDFVTSAFASQLAKKINYREAIIKVGNLDAVRDFTDVRDMVTAYYMAVTSDRIKYGEPYNICSGYGHKIQEVLDTLLTVLKTDSTVKITIEKDPKLNRPSDVPLLVGNCVKFKEATGWAREITFEQMLIDIFDYWKEEYEV